MTQTNVSLLVLFLLLVVSLPLVVRWARRRVQRESDASSMASKVVSAVAVGPQQRVVTVEVGPKQARVWLVLGVTAQAVTCLHRMPADATAVATTAVGERDHVA